MKKFIKFREPNSIIPEAFTAIELDIYALVLCELSKKQALPSRVNSRNNWGREMVFTNDELLSVFGCSSHHLSRNIKKSAKSLLSKKIWCQDHGKFSLLSSAEYYSNYGLCLTLSATAHQYISAGSHKNFSEVNFEHYLKVKSKYSKRLLVMVSRWRNHKNRKQKLDVDSFRKYLGVPEGRYKKHESFTRKCLKEPIKELQEVLLLKPFDEALKGFQSVRKGKDVSWVVLMLNFNMPVIEDDEHEF